MMARFLIHDGMFFRLPLGPNVHGMNGRSNNVTHPMLPFSLATSRGVFPSC